MKSGCTSYRSILVALMLMVFSVWPAVSPSFAENQPQPEYQMAIMPAIGFLQGITGFGAGVDFTMATGDSLYVGMDTGYYRFRQTVSTPSGISLSLTYSSIPVLASVLYRFTFGSSQLHPYIGVAAGASLSTGSFDSSSSGASSTTFVFEVLSRAGLEIDLGGGISLMAEPKVGIIDGSFIFLPQVGVAFAL